MIITLIICFCFGVAPLAFFVCVCTLISMWLALGSSHLFLRMPVFLFCTLSLGLIISIIETQHFDITIMCLFGVMLLAFSFTRSHLLFQLLGLTFGLFLLAIVFVSRGLEVLDSAWVVRVTLAMSFVAGAVAAIRLFGFELVNLTEGISNVELESGTGRDLDQWIAMLDAADGASLNHANLMAILRPFGFSYTWQRTIIVAYEKTLGRRTFGTDTEHRQTIAQDSPTEGENAMPFPTQPRYTIRQIMLITFCVASLLGFIRTFTRFQPTLGDAQYGIPLAIAVVAIIVAALFSRLTLRCSSEKTLLAWSAVAIISLGIPGVIGLRPSMTLNYVLFITGVPVYAGFLIAAMVLLRDRGYRLVRIISRVKTLGVR